MNFNPHILLERAMFLHLTSLPDKYRLLKCIVQFALHLFAVTHEALVVL